MPVQTRGRLERPRELRRRVVLPARVASDEQWSDACILNLSSRGLMISSSRLVRPGATLRLLRGDRLISARVMWSDGGRAGLQAEQRIAVEDILAAGETTDFSLTASRPVRKRARPASARPDVRIQGRALEFIGVGAIVIMLAAAAGIAARDTLAPPLSKAMAALSGHS